MWDVTETVAKVGENIVVASSPEAIGDDIEHSKGR